VITFAMFPLLVYLAYLADVADDTPPEAELDDSPDASTALEAVGYGKDGRAISRTDVAKVVALKAVEKLSGQEQLQAVASLLLPPQVCAEAARAVWSSPWQLALVTSPWQGPMQGWGVSRPYGPNPPWEWHGRGLVFLGPHPWVAFRFSGAHWNGFFRGGVNFSCEGL
jgi:hypothetical protein